MPRACNEKCLIESTSLKAFGMSAKMIGRAITYVYDILDGIDGKLLEGGGDRLADLVELANLSAIIGNLFRGGIVKASDGAFASNAPHTYPDLLGLGRGCANVEIKIALETNNPKGHLVKPGPHLTVRYVLGDEDGKYERGKENRGKIVWIWEVRVGTLESDHFSVSNTEGDSGKTAVINAKGMTALDVVYCDMDRCPLPKGGRAFKEVAAKFGRDAEQKLGL